MADSPLWQEIMAIHVTNKHHGDLALAGTPASLNECVALEHRHFVAHRQAFALAKAFCLPLPTQGPTENNSTRDSLRFSNFPTYVRDLGAAPGFNPNGDDAMSDEIAELPTDEASYLFPVIQISPHGSTLTQVLEENSTIGTGINGLAVGWKRIITTHKSIDPPTDGPADCLGGVPYGYMETRQ